MKNPSDEQIILNYVPFKVECGKIKEFARAIGSNNPIYFEREIAIEQGYKAIPIPPTFFTVIDYWNDCDFYKLFDLLQINANSVLHGEQQYQYFEDVYEGDTISSQLVVLEQYEKRCKRFYKLQTTYRNQLHQRVAIGQATLIQILEDTN